VITGRDRFACRLSIIPRSPSITAWNARLLPGDRVSGGAVDGIELAMSCLWCSPVQRILFVRLCVDLSVIEF
jgi:hypothetical protein